MDSNGFSKRRIKFIWKKNASVCNYSNMVPFKNIYPDQAKSLLLGSIYSPNRIQYKTENSPLYEE